MAETFDIKLMPAGPDLTIRTGAASKLYDPVKVALTGTIKAPGDFFTQRKYDLNDLNLNPIATGPMPVCHVIANYTERSILLVWDESSEFATKVKGTLALHPALAALTINEEATYNKSELESLIKFQGAYFEDRQAYNKLLGALKDFEGQIGIKFKNADDYKGKAAIEKLTEITHNVPLEFNLAMPIFGGGDVEVFGVEICVGLVSGGVDFWLESTLLHELLIEQTESIFETELERFTDIVIVRQY